MSEATNRAERILDGVVEWIPVPPPDEPTGDLPYETHHGVLKIGDLELQCVQLSNGRRLICRDSFLAILGGTIEDAAK